MTERPPLSIADILDAPTVMTPALTAEARSRIYRDLVNRGRIAYRMGKPRSACEPFAVPEWCDYWRQGWDAAFAEEVRQRWQQYVCALALAACFPVAQAVQKLADERPEQFPDLHQMRRPSGRGRKKKRKPSS